MIRLGVCAAADKAAVLKKIGYDYIELNLTNLSEMTDEQYGETTRLIDQSGLRAEAFNVMIPGKYRLTGMNRLVDREAVQEYVRRVVPKAARLGAKVIVFGSGAARNVPHDYPMEMAKMQLQRFLCGIRDILREYGVRLAIEPLNSKETNIIHTVGEALDIARRLEPETVDKAEKDNNINTVGVLGDTYHMHKQDESFDSFALAGKDLYHVHTAENVRRVYPDYDDGTDYAGLFRALMAAGYDGRVSVEGGTDDFEKDAARAFDVLKRAMKSV